jgi:hypothetical protein
MAAPTAFNFHISAGEVRVLFALLDAADEEGRLRDSPAQARWREARRNLSGIAFEKEGPILWELLADFEAARLLDGSWIRERWHTIKLQVERSKALSNHPFSTEYRS